MPPRNAARSLLTEAALAERIAYEREKRNMTYDGLAKRMTDAGCPINQSALYKIEKGEPRRRITVEEWMAFSTVFDVPVEQLLLPPEMAESRRLGELVLAHVHATRAATRANLDRDEAWENLRRFVHAHPELEDKLADHLSAWASEVSKDDDEMTRFLVAYQMQRLTGDAEKAAGYRRSVEADLEKHFGSAGANG